jgi:hypothetical protein
MMRGARWLLVPLAAAAVQGQTLLPAGQPLPPVDHEQYPAYAAVLAAAAPPADRYDIARRLYGVQVVPPQASLRPWAAGDNAEFSAINTALPAVASITAELIVAGDTHYLWAEQPQAAFLPALRAFSQRFDDAVYHQVRGLWGSEASPGVDGDARIHILFTRFINPQTDGYFTSQHSYPAVVVPGSNEKDMLVLNLANFESAPADNHMLSRAAHEFQHMIRHAQDMNESAWVDEGYSVWTEKWLGLSDNFSLAAAFFNNPDTQLNAWDGSLANYGASLAFVQYFYERYGLDALREHSVEPADGLAGFDVVLRRLGTDVDTFFADWVLANGLQRPELGLGYRKGWPLAAARVATVDASAPYTAVAQVRQYATHYYAVNAAGGTLDVTLDVPADVGLLPDAPPQGRFFMYSGTGDESSTSLTRAFDLAAVGQATLRYRLWYDLETYWDYAYVLVSVDGGERWQVLNTARTTADNPNNRAYGPGYTGQSLGWQGDQVDLTPFAGQQILLRFEMITDDALAKTGLALDDIHIPELAYHETFEADDGGWQRQGWARTDNRLPQRAWLQIAQVAEGELRLSRYLLQGAARVQVPLSAGALVALSPFAPVTAQPIAYTLRLEVLP